MMTQVLCINSDSLFVTPISSLVAAWGYETRTASSSELACKMVRSSQFVAAIVDDALPGSMSGVHLCRELRASYSPLGIIYLYTRERAEEALEAFSMGADDCIAKMPTEAEFRARLAALIRRSLARNEKEKVFYGSIELEPVGRVVTVQGSRVDLTPTQYRMLDYILRNVGRAIGPCEFKQSIFRSEQSVDSSKLRVHIFELRRRLGSMGRLIESVRGKGYGVGVGLSSMTDS
jgi:two-component system phosphate regulon response regulator PhoB